MPDRRRVAVVGGGITGLATAYFLQQAGVAVTLIEADDRLGGKIRTDALAGAPVEAGPDAFLARVPSAVDLCRELGLGDELVAPATGAAFIWTSGGLRPLPGRHVLGVPTALRPLVRSGVLSPTGVARAALDLVLPRSRFGDDPSVAEVIGRRMGGEVLDRLVGPLVGGINAGDPRRLSLRSTAPQLSEAAARHRSLVVGLRRRPTTAAGASGPVFLSVDGGLQRLVDRLAEVLAPDTDIRVATTVAAVERDEAGAQWRIVTGSGDSVDVDGCVLTTPAPAAARLLRPLVPIAAAQLDRIRYASVTLATLGYRPGALPAPLAGSGYLVPRSEGRLHTACTFTTTKWPALARSELVLVRASAGRDGDDRARDLDDDELVARLHREVAPVIRANEPPVVSRVDRWPQSFPQYDVGHQAEVERIDATLAAETPGVVVAGAAYRGLGIASCIAQARQVAARFAAAVPLSDPR